MAEFQPLPAYMGLLLRSIEQGAELAPYGDAIQKAPTWMARLDAIRAYYAKYEELNGVDYDSCDPYAIGLHIFLTPIEELLWQDIRSTGRTPMVMQYPVGPYNLDFANPTKKVAIEADGKEFHDLDRDEARDTRLWKEFGWKVYRVTGTECHRRLPSPEDVESDFYAAHGYSPTRREVHHAAWVHFMKTSTGVVRAIRAIEFGFSLRPGYEDLMIDTLNCHRLARFPIGGRR